MSHFVIIGLGSNLGDREANLRQAITHLTPHLEQIKESSVYASPAMLPQDAPADWDMPFLNMAVCGNTTLSSHDLLAQLQQIETQIGRTPTAHWGPREIDLDLLAYDQEVIHSAPLHIPHPGMLERAFVLVPVCDIAPHWTYPKPSPDQGKTIHEILWSKLDNTQNCQLFKTKLP